MKTWSIAAVIDDATHAFVRGYTLAAVGAQTVWDGFHTLERETRPPRRSAESEDGETIGESADDDVLAQLCQLTYFAEDIRNILAQHTSAVPETAAASPAPDSDIAPSPGAGRSTWPVRDDGILFVADLLAAADVLRDVGPSPDPRNYNYAALAERLSAAADYLAQPK